MACTKQSLRASHLRNEATKQNTSEPRIVDICTLFDRQFFKKFQTRVVFGYDEPLYKPCGAPGDAAEIQCRSDYVSSALHEIAHWCVAGKNRREQLDYGYWYEPDGRTEDQQRVFEQVEAKPQALEWIFSMAIGIHFRVSADNLQLGVGPSRAFKEAIVKQAHASCRARTHTRAHDFALALAEYYGQSNPFDKSKYCLSLLS